METIQGIAKEFAITEAAAKELLRYMVDRMKYGHSAKRINLRQMKSLAAKGYLERGPFCSCDLTDSGVKLAEKLINFHNQQAKVTS